MSSTYGQIIEGLTINGQPANYPVVNERAIRATAGIMFLLGITTFLTIVYTRDYTMMYIIVPLFWLDFFLKAVISPKYSIFGLLGKLFVRKQNPEYVGAIQKRFAWSIGLLMASIMIIFAIGLGMRGILPFAVCSTCLAFMWMESALGICAGCKIYGFLIKKQVIKSPEHRPACPGGVCTLKT